VGPSFICTCTNGVFSGCFWNRSCFQSLGNSCQNWGNSWKKQKWPKLAWPPSDLHSNFNAKLKFWKMHFEFGHLCNLHFVQFSPPLYMGCQLSWKTEILKNAFCNLDICPICILYKFSPPLYIGCQLSCKTEILQFGHLYNLHFVQFFTAPLHRVRSLHTYIPWSKSPLHLLDVWGRIYFICTMTFSISYISYLFVDKELRVKQSQYDLCTATFQPSLWFHIIVKFIFPERINNNISLHSFTNIYDYFNEITFHLLIITFTMKILIICVIYPLNNHTVNLP